MQSRQVCHSQVAPLLTLTRIGFAHTEIGRYLRELVEGCLQVLDNFRCQNRRIRQIGRIAQTVIPEPEDIEISLIALDQVFVGEAPETLRFTP